MVVFQVCCGFFCIYTNHCLPFFTNSFLLAAEDGWPTVIPENIGFASRASLSQNFSNQAFHFFLLHRVLYSKKHELQALCGFKGCGGWHRQRQNLTSLNLMKSILIISFFSFFAFFLCHLGLFIRSALHFLSLSLSLFFVFRLIFFIATGRKRELSSANNWLIGDIQGLLPIELVLAQPLLSRSRWLAKNTDIDCFDYPSRRTMNWPNFWLKMRFCFDQLNRF